MRICCTMIVKNEAHVIQRCLESVLPLVDCVCICDTGSTDNTWEAVHEALTVVAETGQPSRIQMLGPRVPFVFMRCPWVNFGHNRTQAFRIAEREFKLDALDWHLVIDADDVLLFEPASEHPELHLPEHMRQLDGAQFVRSVLQQNTSHDCFRLIVHHANIANSRPHLFRADGKWEYRGPLHEAAYRVEGEPEPSKGDFSGRVVYRVVGGGARSLVSQEAKFAADVATLEAHLAEHPEDARSVFYLAQSLKDAGRINEAIRVYLRCSRMQGWVQERYYALLQAGRLMRFQRFYLGAMQELQKAHLMDSTRAEAPFEVAKLMCEPDWDSYWEANPCGRPAPVQAYLWAEIAATRPEPSKGALFAEPQVWEWSKALAAELRGKLCG